MVKVSKIVGCVCKIYTSVENQGSNDHYPLGIMRVAHWQSISVKNKSLFNNV